MSTEPCLLSSFCDSILANVPVDHFVSKFLDAGIDVNANLAPFIPDMQEAVTSVGGREISVKNDFLVGKKHDDESFVSALHLAVVNIYHRPAKNSFHLLCELLDHGADVNAASDGIVVFCLTFKSTSRQLRNGSTPYELALWMKKIGTRNDTTEKKLDEAMRVLHVHASSLANGQTPPRLMNIDPSPVQVQVGQDGNEQRSTLNHLCVIQ